MSVPLLPPIAEIFDAAGRVAVDTACVHCGYNLRTLLSEGVCPECGQPVAASLQGFFLHFASPAWVRGLAHGLRLVLLGLVCLIIVPMIVGAIVALTAFLNMRGTLAAPTQFAQGSSLIQFSIQALGQAILIVGLVWLTRPEPRPPQQSEGYSARRIIRFCCWLLPIPAVGNLVLALNLPTFPAITPSGPPPPGLIGPWLTNFALLAATVALAAMGIYTVATLAVLRHLASLLRRIPRPGLVRGAQVAFWGLLSSTALMCVGYGVMMLTVLPALPGVLAAATAAGATSAPTGGTTSRGVTVTSYNLRYSSTATVVGTSAPSSAASDEAESTAPSANLTGVTTSASAPASAPTTIPTLPAAGPSFVMGMLFGGCGGGVGACGSAIFAIVSVVILIRACYALFAATQAAHAAASPTTS